MRCPICGSIDRERLIFLYLKSRRDFIERLPTLRILHVAPEGRLRRFFMDHRTVGYVTADLRKPKAMVEMDICDIQYPDGTFDTILCSHVLEHVPNDRLALSELYRVLKSGGFAILQVPISAMLLRTYEDPAISSPEERKRVYGQSDHVRLYGADYKQLLEHAGFTVTLYNLAADRGVACAKRYGVSEKEDLYIASKK